MFYVVILQNAPLKKQISLGRSEFTSSQYNKSYKIIRDAQYLSKKTEL